MDDRQRLSEPAGKPGHHRDRLEQRMGNEPIDARGGLQRDRVMLAPLRE